jgi:predicted N-acyltransferase
VSKSPENSETLTLKVLDGLSSVAPGEWDRLVGDESPFLEWGWLASLEESGCVGPRAGWRPQHLALYAGRRLVGACPLYLKGHSEGEFVFDYAWASAAERAGIRYYPKLVVAVPFTPAEGIRFLVDPGYDRRAIVRTLGQVLVDLCREHELSSVHVNFCRPEELEALREIGYVERTGFQYKWRNRDYGDFDGYLDAFRAKRRNQVKRERRELEEQDVTIAAQVGDEIPDELFAPMFDIYLTTIEKLVWGRRYLRPKFFELLRERFRANLCFITARRRGKLLAGTFNVQKSGVFYGRYWGTFEELRHLHFNVCYYAAIEHCIRSGLTLFEPGAGGEFKMLRGFDPEPTRSAHFIAEPRLARAVERFLRAEREEIEMIIGEMRGHSQIKVT